MSKLSPRKLIKTIDKVISLNPTEITFVQKIKKEVDGAFEEETNQRTIKTIVYIEDNSSSISINTGNQGTSYSSTRYKMLADKDSDLDVTPFEKIKFISNGDKFEIKGVYPQVVQDIICGYLCDLERID
ncbi:hypothetical protein CLOBY_34710 [Clostridium saccharobutylicum]|uniref:hypothetical protein n=1 Tax=Clostridium saccharobutylicum TaxID=169679 RepID=UPI000983C037|nr:hypothetical protein [Clostridium saccharobutylicum]AQS11315.1 hypothetical protein CLOBY_34710 [Clostridium saccharobutylicum]MBC2437144.1 hypothetical protein [Clostridium saccharobutylicum]NSB88708.1 hypothetical protein [Clostridium saccharobutylicum]NYC30714.1 hypothetical protein [Clostridium saccharobutylicum]OOM15405.1 hypothetical protein CLSAB_26750 [Clostridium saccharobutylicum]